MSTGRVTPRRRAALFAGLTAAVVLALAGLLFVWAGRNDQAEGPAPASANPTVTSAATPAAFRSELHEWIEALPAGGPPASPYWHDGTLYVRGEQIPAPFAAVDIVVAGDTVLLGGSQAGSVPYQGSTVSGSNDWEAEGSQWGIVRGGQLQPLPVPAGAQVGLSVDGRIAYWVTHMPGTKQFFTWDTETSTALASRTVNGRQVELWGIDAAGNGYWQEGATSSNPYTRWDVRTDTVTATDLPSDLLVLGPELFDGSVPWMHQEFAYRSPDGTKTLITDSVPRENPSVGVMGDTRLRVRPAGPDDSVDPKSVITLAISHEFPDEEFLLGYRNGSWLWWESNESILLSVDGDDRTYLLRCSADGRACQRVVDFGTLAYPPDASDPAWKGNWGFARTPTSN